MIPGFDVIPPAIRVVLQGNDATRRSKVFRLQLGVDVNDLFVESHDVLRGAGEEGLQATAVSGAIYCFQCPSTLQVRIQLDVVSRAVEVHQV